jgi:hypothetical protein
MAGSRRKGGGFWPRIPRSVLGMEIPNRFRGFGMRFRDPDRVLIEFISWLDAGGRPTKASGDGSGAAERDRRQLLEACMELSDRLSNEALRQRLLAAMAGVGVEPIDPDGEVFDPERHHAIFRTPASNSSQHGRVASTERLGFADRGKIIRRPEVAVFREEE